MKVSSANVHLASLYSYFKLGAPLDDPAKIKQELTRHKTPFRRLTPPDRMDDVTVADVLLAESPEQHRKLVIKWPGMSSYAGLTATRQ